MEETTNSTFNATLAPKIQDTDGAYVPVKYDFQNILDRDKFEGREDMVKKFANGIVKQKKDGTPMTEICVHKKGTVNSKFIEVHNLISCSHSDYFIAFFLS